MLQSGPFAEFKHNAMRLASRTTAQLGVAHAGA